MKGARIDALARSLSDPRSRRSALGAVLGGAVGLLGGTLASWRDAEEVAAGRHKRRKQRNHRQSGNNKSNRKGLQKGKRKGKNTGMKPCTQVGQVPQKGQSCCAGLAPDANRQCAQSTPEPPPPPCVPGTCPANACDSLPDGCGGTLSCGSCGNAQVCHDGACRACHVCASGCPFSSVNEAIAATTPQLTTIYICPGTYSENFGVGNGVNINRNLNLVGAGGDDDPAQNSILQPGELNTRTVLVHLSAVATLTALRITGADTGGVGAGLLVTNNSEATLVGCTVAGNTSTAQGTGISVSNGGVVTLDATCRVSGNRADLGDADSGGGIFNENGEVNLAADTIVCGNTPDQCGGDLVDNCNDLLVTCP